MTDTPLDARFDPGQADARWQRAWDEAGTFVADSDSPKRSEEHTSELQSLMRISYAVFWLKKKKKTNLESQEIVDSTHQLHKIQMNRTISRHNVMLITNSKENS